MTLTVQFGIASATLLATPTKLWVLLQLNLRVANTANELLKPLFLGVRWPGRFALTADPASSSTRHIERSEDSEHRFCLTRLQEAFGRYSHDYFLSALHPVESQDSPKDENG